MTKQSKISRANIVASQTETIAIPKSNRIRYWCEATQRIRYDTYPKSLYLITGTNRDGEMHVMQFNRDLVDSGVYQFSVRDGDVVNRGDVIGTVEYSRP